MDLLGGSILHSRGYSILMFFSVCGAILIVSGCIFPDEDVSIDIYGPDVIAPNITKTKGVRIRINNDVDHDFENMLVKIIVPERIHFKGYVMGKPLELEKGLEWVYNFTTNLEAGETSEYPFSYKPEIYEAELVDGEYSFTVKVMAYDADGVSIGNASTTWRVVRT